MRVCVHCQAATDVGIELELFGATTVIPLCAPCGEKHPFDLIEVMVEAAKYPVEARNWYAGNCPICGAASLMITTMVARYGPQEKKINGCMACLFHYPSRQEACEWMGARLANQVLRQMERWNA